MAATLSLLITPFELLDDDDDSVDDTPGVIAIMVDIGAIDDDGKRWYDGMVVSLVRFASLGNNDVTPVWNWRIDDDDNDDGALLNR